MADLSAPEALAHRLRILFGRLRRRLQDASSVGDLPAPQASALARLAANEPSSASELAGAEKVRPQSMAKTVTALEDRALVRREADELDGRRQLLFLTEAGRAAAEGARSNREEWLAGVFAERFTDAERQIVARAFDLLERVVEP
jgi:DNA-binding MarR family transcriptional regulator